MPGVLTRKPDTEYASAGRVLKDIGIGVLLTAAVAFLFYRSIWALLLGAVLIPLYLWTQRNRNDERRTQEMTGQFLSGMQMVAASLTVGYSMENAWRRAEKELIALYGPDAAFCVEMRHMNQQLAVNEPFEKVLSGFAERSGVEDIVRFAEVFGYAKKSGGNLTEILRSVTERMQEKTTLLSEVETALASQRMEQRMMDLLLPGILLFITISSPSYVTALYHNPLGIFVMTACLAGYLGCIFWSEKLMDITI